MHSLAFMAPILPGQSEHARRFAQQISGPRRKEMAESRQAKAVTRESSWLQPSPMGEILLVYLEGDDILKANREFAASQTPFDTWFKQEVMAFTGVDYSQPLPEGTFEPLFETPMVGQRSSLAIALPVAPGQTEHLKRWAQEQYGARRNEFQDFLRRAGIARAGIYLAHTPQGDFAIQYSEADDPPATYRYFATSTHTYDQWNREQLATIHGVDFTQPMPALPEPGFDYRSDDRTEDMRKSVTPGRRMDQGTSNPTM